MKMSIYFDEWELIHPLEILRKTRTNLNQKEFLKATKISKVTYRRWTTEQTVPRYTAEQLTAICKVCRIDADTFLSFMTGEIDIEELQS